MKKNHVQEIVFHFEKGAEQKLIKKLEKLHIDLIKRKLFGICQRQLISEAEETKKTNMDK